MRGKSKKKMKEIRALISKVELKKDKAEKDIIDRANVIAATLIGTMRSALHEIAYDVVIVDEAVQALECATWLAIMKGKKVILAGDHLQLAPTIMSERAKQGGLELTLFERLIDTHGETIAKTLSVQYRMNEKIMGWSSKEFYQSILTAHQSVKKHRLIDIASTTTENLKEVLCVLDTAGSGMSEIVVESSYKNVYEAALVEQEVRRLTGAGIKQKDIGIIAPYRSQVALLRKMLSSNFKGIEVSTVDGFQGQEKEAILVSMVRSNAGCKVGFLCNPRRMNVAMTRARRYCCLICDSTTIGSNKFLNSLLQYFSDNGKVTKAKLKKNKRIMALD